MDRHILDAEAMRAVLAAIKLPTEKISLKKGWTSRFHLSWEVEGIRGRWKMEDVSTTITFD